MGENENRVLEAARAFVALLRAEDFAGAVELFAPPLRAAVPAEALRLAWTTETDGRGGVTAIGEPVARPGDEPVRVHLPVSCGDGGFTVVTSVGADGLLHGLRLDPGEAAAW
ncbi:hypothetical protein ACIRVF_28340 [Kitasatospora sp. NPDC101157]|uniref:hypothetical protein n=1 Tax=Kitasatospora sp. NPDC101157 TaxID=3364098 RepID=UPI003807B7BF